MQQTTMTAQGAHGLYLSPQPDGRVLANGPAPAAWEQLRVEPIAGQEVALRSWQDYYVTAELDGTVRARAKNVFDWERWTVLPGETDGTIAFRSYHGLVMTAEPDGRVVCRQPAVHAWESWQSAPDGWWLDAPTPSHPNPLIGHFRIDGHAYAHDAGDVLPVFAHVGDLLAIYVRARARAQRLMDRLVIAGYHGPRSWLQLGCGNGQLCPVYDHLGRPTFWRGLEVGPEVTPNYWDEFADFVADLSVRGLRLVASQGDPAQLGHTMADRRQRAAQYARVVREVDGTGHTIAFFDAGNEAIWNDADRFYQDPANCASFIQAYKDAGGTAICTLTSPENETPQRLNDYSIPPADAWDSHTWRADHSWDKRRHCWGHTYAGEGGPPKLWLGMSSEGPGNGVLVSASDNKHELDHEAMANIGAASLMARMAYVWFSGEGVKETGHLQDEQGFEACARLHQWLPRDVMRFRHSHHSGPGQEQHRVFRLPVGTQVRMDGVAHDDGRRAYIVDGPSGSYPFLAEKNFDGIIVNTGTNEAHPFSARAGETKQIEWTRGRLLVGMAS